jgi:hypothetical protein
LFRACSRGRGSRDFRKTGKLLSECRLGGVRGFEEDTWGWRGLAFPWSNIFFVNSSNYVDRVQIKIATNVPILVRKSVLSPCLRANVKWRGQHRGIVS